MPTFYKILVFVVILIALGTAGYALLHDSSNKSIEEDNAIRYLPLGDSYTIGQSVSQNERWPNQLTKLFAKNGKTVRIVENPSVTGYTTQDLIDRELSLVVSKKPDFVSILIGVNDYVQGIPYEEFAANFEEIVTFVQENIAQPENILLVTIPDYSLTPAGSQYGNPQLASEAIQKFNAHIVSTGKARNLPVADIFEISRGVAKDNALVANDGLHPSGKQYALWTELIYKTLTAAGLPAVKS